MTKRSQSRSNKANPKKRPHVPAIEAANDTPTLAQASVLPGGVTLRYTLEGYAGLVWSVAWSPDGKLLASGTNDGTVRWGDSTSGRLRYTFEGHVHQVLSVAWSPNGKLASGSGDKTVRLWDSTNGRLLHTLEGHTNLVNSVAWS